QCVGLVANTEKAGAPELLNDLRKEFARHGRRVVFEANTAALIGLNSSLRSCNLAEECDLIVVLGGDGTILQALQDLGECTRPIFGINLGTLGFLTSVGAAAYLHAVETIVSGRYRLSERTLLRVELMRGGKSVFARSALNDAVISRGELSRLIRLDVRIDGALLTEYNADGLIVSTPTGSTAYSLSAGGPVLAPESGVFVITPICPHVLTNRSVIVSDHSRIEITPAPGQGGVFLTVDGREAQAIEPDDAICITKARYRLALAMLPEMTFFEVLRQKLKWSGTAV
ncbi:MAG: NAD(+)/NADH kinase, partial [Verrucomicrobiaceae bacterium]